MKCEELFNITTICNGSDASSGGDILHSGFQILPTMLWEKYYCNKILTLGF
jgi:hypothetical protein